MPQLSYETFAPHLNDQFTVIDSTGTDLTVKLVEVSSQRKPGDISSEPIAAQVRNDPFTLLFRAVVGARLDQGIYEFRHQALATNQIFIVPVGVDGKGEYYEAVFN